MNNLKKGNYRNKKIIDAAEYSPVCFGCGAHNRGQVVAVHSDWNEHGKGGGIKAHDCFIAYLCSDVCHHWLHTDKDATKEEKKEFWRLAYDRTTLYLHENGIVK